MLEITDLRDAEKSLQDPELKLINAWWHAANYLSVGQIYLLDNPLLREPLAIRHIKPRLLGHWGTTPGLNFIYVHLNRAIKARDLDVIYVAGPGHGGPGLVANVWLEGTYSEIYPLVPANAVGMQRLFKQFSFPGGVPSHAAPETPGSIHEVANSATRSRTHMVRHSTIQTLSSPALLGMARLRPAQWRLPGIPISFSIR
jgi:xylulose-5-phosphate/fructose-6-phosphate phosphoketolase